MANPSIPRPVNSDMRNIQQQPQVWTDYTVYELDFSSAGAANFLTAGLATSLSFQVQADSNFIWQKACYSANQLNAAYDEQDSPVPNIACNIRDSGSGRQLFNTAVPVPSIFGRGQLPFILPVQRIFMANSLVTVDVSNYDAAAGYNLRLSFIGSKQFVGGTPAGFM